MTIEGSATPCTEVFMFIDKTRDYNCICVCMFVWWKRGSGLACRTAGLENRVYTVGAHGGVVPGELG